MAKAKTSGGKSRKSSTKPKGSKASKPGAKKPAKAAAPKRARVAPAGLSNDQKQRLLKPGADYDTVVEQILPVWAANRRYVRVEGLSGAKIASRAKRANRKWEKERAFRQKMDAKLQPLMDDRMREEDALMRDLLDLHAEVKTAARRRPELLDAFAPLIDFCGRGGRKAGDDGGDAGDGGAPPTGGGS